MQPLVSVIVPVYNVEKYIGECLTSIVGQTYQNLEILIVDDKGNDGSMAIAQRYTADPRVRIVRHEKNRGLGPARNTGISQARGKYIYFVDSDDWIDSRAIEDLVEAAEKTQSDIVNATVDVFANDETTVNVNYATSINHWLQTMAKSGVYDVNLENYRKICYEVAPVMAWSKLFLCEFLNKGNLRFVDAKLEHEDEGFFHKCLVNSPRIAVIDTRSYHYRIRSDSIMGRHEERASNQKDLSLVVKDTLKYIRKHRIRGEFAQLIHDHYRGKVTINFGPFQYYWGTELKHIWLDELTFFKLITKNRTTEHASYGSVVLHVGPLAYIRNPRLRIAGLCGRILFKLPNGCQTHVGETTVIVNFGVLTYIQNRSITKFRFLGMTIFKSIRQDGHGKLRVLGITVRRW